MIRFFLIILCSFFILISATYSKNYNKIKIDGNSRISDETIIVFSELPDKKFLDENSLNLILKKLFNTGFFKDIRIKIETDVLKIAVIENPIIQSVLINGIKSKSLKETQGVSYRTRIGCLETAQSIKQIMMHFSDIVSTDKISCQKHL